ncbi:Spo0E family sporulation regulatory protein-aspartic acid phosphatase [Paenibacillus xylanilyticus]|uniref:Spo0E family sporulation regulatory protein-aspartic acid phosphatase n=1 Tax=Paenibacillus xylanilyticus TaxID=248903 RepID=UPI0039A0E07D
MKGPSQVVDQIERNRQELSRLAEHHGMQDYKVLQQSMVLDELINEYNRFKYRKQQQYMNRQPIA